ncbi:hypothetical protein Q31b_48180 [Novipirellula aureliae]|uniref:DoxX n=1 Tax=Novipirellula aureliae TaxID=2527966 RepID=A0A5C6DL48_9BACT|nr:hypothetical protein [Novipirellula aureliae]TWU36537.1 hypothetical protein Q31b_48180 [Novipirellula aureliae]
MSLPIVRLIFGVAAAYDFLIGLVFLLAGKALFDASGIPYPNHWGYIQFGSLMLITFGIMFFCIAVAPAGNRNLMPFGMLLKISYVGMVTYYWITTGCPFLFKPFAVIDLLMLVLFVIAYRSTAPLPHETPTKH